MQAEWVEPFELISIIETPDLGPIALRQEFVCKKLKIAVARRTSTSCKEAHDRVYTAGFYKGVMSAGPFKGQTVQEAKPSRRRR